MERDTGHQHDTREPSIPFPLGLGQEAGGVQLAPRNDGEEQWDRAACSGTYLHGATAVSSLGPASYSSYTPGHCHAPAGHKAQCTSPSTATTL